MRRHDGSQVSELLSECRSFLSIFRFIRLSPYLFGKLLGEKCEHRHTNAIVVRFYATCENCVTNALRWQVPSHGAVGVLGKAVAQFRFRERHSVRPPLPIPVGLEGSIIRLWKRDACRLRKCFRVGRFYSIFRLGWVFRRIQINEATETIGMLGA